MGKVLTLDKEYFCDILWKYKGEAIGFEGDLNRFMIRIYFYKKIESVPKILRRFFKHEDRCGLYNYDKKRYEV